MTQHFVFRYEKAWFPSGVSLCCSVFTEEDLKLFEFQEDLEYYYNYGPAYKITSKMTQPIFTDLFAKIDDKKTHKKQMSAF